MWTYQNASTFKKTSFDCLLKLLFEYHDIANLSNLQDSAETTWTFFALSNAMFALPTTVINLLIIWTILGDKKLRKVPHNVLLAALAVTDFFEGLIVEPLFSWFLGSLVMRRPITCHFVVFAVPALIVSCWTLNTLALSSVDLYLAVEHPQFYIRHITSKNVFIGTGVFWVLNALFLLVGRVLVHSKQRLKKIPNAAVMAINIFITMFCTVKVQITAYRKRRAIQAQVQAVKDTNTSNSTDEDDTRGQHFKYGMTMTLILLATFLFYCPYIINSVILSFKGKNVTDDFKYINFAIDSTFVHLQSLVNPIVVSLRLSYIRKGVKDKLLC